MNAEEKTGNTCWVWGVEGINMIITVRAIAPTYDELLNMIGIDGEMPIPDDCDGICDILPATPKLYEKIRREGPGIRCALLLQNGEYWFDVLSDEVPYMIS